MRALIIGYGLQGRKRQQAAKDEVVGIVDPVATEAQYKTLSEVPLSTFDIAFLCVPDGEKIPLLIYLLENKKPTLVEKPLLFSTPETQKKLLDLSKKTVCYTAYNHRFEPHIKKIKNVLTEKALGQIYAMHLFYGNGTAASVRASPWRDQGRGVVQDLGSHLLDITHYWEPAFKKRNFSIVTNACFENKAPDYAILHSLGKPYAHLTMTFLSWKNSFFADIWGEKGSIHMNGLCKWGPSHLTIRHRVYPSGKPIEETVVLNDPDNTWTEEYRYFLSCIEKGKSNIENDIWIEHQL
jgi:predicted dehydrogenase